MCKACDESIHERMVCVDVCCVYTLPLVLCGVYFNEQSMLEVVMDVLCCVLCIEVNKARQCQPVEDQL